MIGLVMFFPHWQVTSLLTVQGLQDFQRIVGPSTAGFQGTWCILAKREDDLGTNGLAAIDVNTMGLLGVSCRTFSCRRRNQWPIGLVGLVLFSADACEGGAC